MRYGAVQNPVLLTLVNPGKPKKALKHVAGKAKAKKLSVPSKAKRIGVKKTLAAAVVAAAVGRAAKQLTRQVKVEAKRAARAAVKETQKENPTMKRRTKKATKKHATKRGFGRNPMSEKEKLDRKAARKTQAEAVKAAAKAAAKEAASKVRAEAKAAYGKQAVEAKQAAKAAAVSAKRAATSIEDLREGYAKIAKKARSTARKSTAAARKERKATVKRTRAEGALMREAIQALGIKTKRVSKKGKKIRVKGRALAGRITPTQLAAMGMMSAGERKKAFRAIQRAYGKERGAQKRVKRVTAAFKTGPRAERMPEWANRDFARFPVPAMPTGPLVGKGSKRHMVAVDPWRPYTTGKGVPGWVWYPQTALQQAHFKYHKNPGKKSHRVSRKGGIVGSIKRFFAVKKNPRGYRRNPPSTGAEILKNTIAGTGAFLTGRLIGNLAAKSGWFGSVERYVPVGASLANVLAMHMLSGRIAGFQEYRTALLAGAGIQLVETVIDAFAPANVNAMFDRPGGLGADLNVYEAALQDDMGYDLGSDEELLAGVSRLGEYVSLNDDMGEYLSTEGVGEYLLPAEDDMGEYVMEGTEDELADGAIDELIGVEDGEELTEMGDEVLADEVLADDMGDDLGDLGAEAAPAPAPFVGAAVPESVAKRGPKAIAAYRKRMARKTPAVRKAAALARASGHPAGGVKGQIVAGTTSGGIFGRMAAAPKGVTAPRVRAAVRAAVPAVPGAIGTPVHFAQVQAKVARAVGTVPPAATLVAYRAETAGPAAAVRTAKRLGVAKAAKARVVVKRGTGGMLEFSRPTTKRALLQPRVRSVYEKPSKEDEQGVFKGDIFSGDRV